MEKGHICTILMGGVLSHSQTDILFALLVHGYIRKGSPSRSEIMPREDRSYVEGVYILYIRRNT